MLFSLMLSNLRLNFEFSTCHYPFCFVYNSSEHQFCSKHVCQASIILLYQFHLIPLTQVLNLEKNQHFELVRYPMMNMSSLRIHGDLCLLQVVNDFYLPIFIYHRLGQSSLIVIHTLHPFYFFKFTLIFSNNSCFFHY